MAVHGVVAPVAAILPVFPAGTYRHCIGTSAVVQYNTRVLLSQTSSLKSTPACSLAMGALDGCDDVGIIAFLGLLVHDRRGWLM